MQPDQATGGISADLFSGRYTRADTHRILRDLDSCRASMAAEWLAGHPVRAQAVDSPQFLAHNRVRVGDVRPRVA